VNTACAAPYLRAAHCLGRVPCACRHCSQYIACAQAEPGRTSRGRCILGKPRSMGDQPRATFGRSTSWQEEALQTPTRSAPAELSCPHFDDAAPRCWPRFGRWTVLAAGILMQGMGGIMYPTSRSCQPPALPHAPRRPRLVSRTAWAALLQVHVWAVLGAAQGPYVGGPRHAPHTNTHTHSHTHDHTHARVHTRTHALTATHARTRAQASSRSRSWTR
jgi:hypothetical protein